MQRKCWIFQCRGGPTLTMDIDVLCLLAERFLIRCLRRQKLLEHRTVEAALCRRRQPMLSLVSCDCNSNSPHDPAPVPMQHGSKWCDRSRFGCCVAKMFLHYSMT